MTFFFWRSSSHRRKITKTITATAALACFFENNAEAQADLSMAIDGRTNTVLMPGLHCSPNDPVWTNFANFRLFLNRQALGYFGIVFRYDLGWKLKENLEHCLAVCLATAILILTERASDTDIVCSIKLLIKLDVLNHWWISKIEGLRRNSNNFP